METTHLARINSTEFGKIVIDGKEYSTDVIITANGDVIKREDISEKKYGTNHIICKEELQLLLQGSPRIIVIGTGQYGACRVETEAKREFIANGIKLIVERTPRAIQIFNNIGDRKAGLFHLTC